MKFDFQSLKPKIQAEFDEVVSGYPGDTSEIRARMRNCKGDALDKKLAVIEAAAELCPVHVFGYFPFAMEIDAGYRRDAAYMGVGAYVRQECGVDFTPLNELRRELAEHQLGQFNDYYDSCHRMVDYDLLLSRGYKGVYEDCERLNMVITDHENETDQKKRRYREAVMRVCLAAKRIGERIRSLAAEELARVDDNLQKLAPDCDETRSAYLIARHNLERIAVSANTPWEPPKTMFDALNSMLCCILWTSVLDGMSMNTLGWVDRLIYPFYRRDIESGLLNEDEAVYLLRCFLYKTDAHSAFSPERMGFDSGVTVMIGGCYPDGRPLYNHITDMIIDAYLDNNFINPKLNARASDDSDPAYIHRLAELILSGNNNIIVENDDHIIPMFVRMSVDITDARRYIGGGCQEVVTPNHMHHRAFVYLNLPKVLLDTLELTADEIELTDDEIELTAGTAQNVSVYKYGRFERDSFDVLYESFLLNLRSYIRTLAESFHPYERLHSSISPEPLLSALVGDCVERGLDVTEGGARYNHNTLSFVGFGTLCDSLLALRSAYRDGRVDELLAAMRSNFDGCDKLRAELLHGSDRFGHSTDADEFARELADKLANVSRGIYTSAGVEWHTSLFAYYLFKNLGEVTRATPDGRLKGEPFSRGMNMASLGELTQMALSLAKICGAEFDDVGVFDLTLPLSHGDEYVDAVAKYITACVKLNIPVLQPSAVDREKLIEERSHKGTHPEIVVRVCGYSAVFGLLSASMQDEIIGRAE